VGLPSYVTDGKLGTHPNFLNFRNWGASLIFRNHSQRPMVFPSANFAAMKPPAGEPFRMG
jgi:hypothetical protein